jgi:predicted Zn-ribbon and HTH transcriptional regulator
MCGAHYQAWWKRQNPEKVAKYNAGRRHVQGPLEGRACLSCGNRFDAQHINQTHCTPTCRTDKYTRHRDHKTETLVCSNCEGIFKGVPDKPSRKGWARYCSDECQAEARGWKNRTIFSSKIPWAQCAGCGAQYVRRNSRTSKCGVCRDSSSTNPRFTAGYCLECHEPFIGRWHPKWPPQYCCEAHATKAQRRNARERNGRHSTHRKRAKLYGCEYEPVNRSKVFQRDGYVCQICHEPTSREYDHADPWSPTIDHIIPMSKQGGHTYDNVQCAHAFCNSVKCDREDHQAKALLGV